MSEQTRSTTKKDLPPKPSDGYTTTRASRASDGIPSVPSCGGTFRKNGAADCDDALGEPGRFDRTPPADANVVSGRGPAAAAKQDTTGRRTGINSQTKDEYAKDSGVEDINPKKRMTPKR